MRVRRADQYGLNCVVLEGGETADAVMDRCGEVDAVRLVDGVEYCVELRSEVGPELWTERALRSSLRSTL